MIHILSRTTKNHQKPLSKPLHSKLKKFQGLAQKFKNLRTFRRLPLKFKDFKDCANPVCAHESIDLGYSTLIHSTHPPLQRVLYLNLRPII